MIKTADRIIDFGPEGGGEIVDAGASKDINEQEAQLHGQFLKAVPARAAGSKRGKRVEAAE